jgi:hypothetical protein
MAFLWYPQVMDRAAIFLDLCLRNKLRREAHLQMLDLKSEYAHEVAKAELAERMALFDKHRAAVRAEVLEAGRKKWGPHWPEDLGSRFYFGALVERTLRQRFG